MPVLPSFAAVPVLPRIEHDTPPQLLALSLAILLRYHKNSSTVLDKMEEEGVNQL
jgi:hypothetical protein